MTEDLVDRAIEEIQNGKHVGEKEVVTILNKLMEILYNEPTLLEIPAPCNICGDIHGQLIDLFTLFETKKDTIGGRPYLFLGDYVDRGYYSLETFLYLACLKIKDPTKIYLLRGNHECREVSKTYGFLEEIKTNYGNPSIWHLCQNVFDLLPLSAVVGGSIFCTHGGLSPDISSIDQIQVMDRQKEIPTNGPMCDLTWSDPDSSGGWAPNIRGAGWLFGAKQTREFLQINKLKLVARAHQLAKDGYLYKFDEQLVTVWSAPNYAFRSDNLACVMAVEENLERDFKIFEAKEGSNRKPDQVLPSYFC